MAVFDWIALMVLALSVVVGLWRGFMFEAVSISGWVAAFFCAQWWAPAVAAWLPLGKADAPWRVAAAFVLVFIGLAFTGGMAAALLRRLVAGVGVGPVDRLLGGLFGAARAVLALLVVAIAVHLLAFEQEVWWRASVSAPWLDQTLQGIKPALPQRLASYLP